MAVSAEPKPLGHPLPGGRPGATVRLRPLKAGEIRVPPTFFDDPGGRFARPRAFLARGARWVWAPVPAFLVEHPSAGPLLIDTGYHPSVGMEPQENLGRLGARLFRARGVDGGVPARLRDLRLDPYRLRTVVMTHLHSDHASGVAEFPEATFVVDEREWSAAGAGGLREGYRHQQFDHAFDWRTLDYNGALSEGLSPFGRTVDLFGDGSVRLVSTPGHTLGHQSVLLRLRDRDALVCGDAAYLRRTIDEDAMPLVCADDHLFRRSLREIRRFVEREPEAVVIPGHDAELWPQLEEVYD
jgi:glyoxylase-like metal-dependent hydrolase (beta-lactamase superfamily II)